MRRDDNNENVLGVEQVLDRSPITRRRRDLDIEMSRRGAPLKELPFFPTTRYYGSKRRQLNWLREEFALLNGKTFLDAFGGTGAVSSLASHMGFDVTYNDVLHFNTVIATALFTKPQSSMSEEDFSEFLRNVRPVQGFVTSSFDELYFTRDENEWIDGLMLALPSVNESLRNIAQYCLFQACLKKRPFNLFHRANLHLRSSTVACKFGNRTTWSTDFHDHMLVAYRELSRSHASSLRSNVRVAPAGPAERLQGDYDIVYIDPPYFQRTRKVDSFLDRYHFLEGLSRYDEWPDLIDQKSPLRKVSREHVNEWVDKHDVLSNIERLLEKYWRSTVLLSYVAGEHPSENELIECFKKKFNRVRISRRQFGRALSKRKFFEILITGSA
jgi:adenine-specific DNA-methyltransferase